MHDPLTGLPNRAFLTEYLDKCVARAERQKDYHFAILFIDLDRFKHVNDRLGHAVGDELLVAVAQRLELCVRKNDVVSRIGGDEFTILLDDIRHVADATRIAEDILEMLSRPILVTGTDLWITPSIGISLSATGANDAPRLLRDADMAMYRAKESGRARYEVFDTAMHAQAVARLKLESDLALAVQRREFRLYYQPVIALESGKICGFEALLRWEHPERGTQNARDFIGIAHESGHILEIGEWIMRQACQQLAVWQKDFPREKELTMSVNLCSREFEEEGLLERMAHLTTDAGLPPYSLRIEVTEGMLMHKPESALILLQQLRGIGIHIQLDDFGQGYSSLTFLNRYPIDTIKIERELVARAARVPADREMVRAIASIANVLKIDVVAEGLETAVQVEAMRGLGCCQFGQGYFYSMPVTAIEATRLLAEESERPPVLALA
jgi:diguanylate cyclase (GGDEF)-like protein